MRYTRQFAAAFAAIAVGVGLFAACVGDSPVGNPDATTPDAGDAGTVDVKPGDSAVGCSARTADDTTGLFVAQAGTDVGSCGTRANPCKTLTYAIATAKTTSGKTTLYVAAAPATDAGPGAYQESIILDAPLSIEGGWSASGGTWTPICDATTSTAVTIQGVTNTTITASFNGTATLRDLRVASKPAADPSESLYGVFVLGSTTNLTLDQVVADIAPGGAGTTGADGTAGANATDAGCAASTGANGGAGAAGTGGAAGTFSASGYLSTNGGDAGNGGVGQNGTAGGAGDCMSGCETSLGQCSSGCQPTYGQKCAANGISGCGGGGGGGGSYGTGGGASIALFVWDAHVTLFGGSFTTSNGGNGGNGGNGVNGGSGTAGAAGSSSACVTQITTPTCATFGCTATISQSTPLNGGVAGGTGGAGGVGGQGGGGSGGVSYDIVQGGDGGVVVNGSPKLAHGDGGAGGALGGASGLAGDKWP
ncbi:MAG TPA: hypothetical protein VLM85_10535 [Polyangiaceae bacterium]|nr:hypothetical protein [Polyangiaceae bacterium]